MNDEPAGPGKGDSASLSSLQRWMQAVIMHPDGVMAGTESEGARQHLDVSPGQLETVVGRSRNLTSDERLEIYHNAYFSRLLECLRNIYPMVAKTLGEEAFDALAIGYLHSYPSGSYTLDRLGDNFARYLHESRPDLDDSGEPTETWPDFLIDLARLEWNIGEVFDGPGVEGQTTLGAEQLLGMDANRWPEVRLTPAPCLRLLSFRFPVNDYFTSLRDVDEDAEPPALPGPAESWLALSRRDFVVRRHALERAQHRLLTSLAGGQTIGAAIGELASTTSVDFDRLAEELRDWFHTWTAAGFFTGLGDPL
ncbi:MAG TPA: DNA-binding domain-containing protein [Pirellulales bacterium]|nr:DNA-binding domain-containing protein [Pirellulales bacterium]